ncbi:hypothetical protein BASA60_002651 [Batrachochytrium salamandrivorans]|nr:hypothetical protein BASA60_002651 [Batrachochytrium salamandrivorans]
MDNHFSNPFVDDVPDWSADFNIAVTPTNSNIASAADATDGPASAPLDRTNTHPRLPLSADPAFGSVYSKADVNAFLAEMLPSETVSGAEATTHLITSDLDGYESDSMELMGHRDDPHLLSMNTFNSETANSIPSAHHDLSARIQPHMDSGSSSEVIRHRASSRRRKRSDLFNLPEKEFLQYILLEQDAQLVHELLSQRFILSVFK